MTPHRILVLTDFEEPSKNALDFALSLAEKLEARITIMHVCAIPDSAYGNAFFWPVEDLTREAKTRLAKIAASAKDRYPRIDTLLSSGDPRKEALAAAPQFDLVVMGTHGRRGLSRALLGSVAEALVRTSPIPVVTVSMQEKK